MFNSKTNTYTIEDPVRDYNLQLFRQLADDLHQKLIDDLNCILDQDMPLEDRIGLCYIYVNDVAGNAKQEMNISYSLSVQEDGSIIQNMKFSPTEDLLEGRTDSLPVMRRGASPCFP